ncbi:MAG: metallophosphoesterase family protein [Melioribacteraceae bacterium]|nr:metallophosphoesterase family protein [Melioribacteraceae bacterium]
MQKKSITVFVLFFTLIKSSSLEAQPYYNNLSNKVSQDNPILFSEDFNLGSLVDWHFIDEDISLKSNWYCENGYLIQDTDAGNKKNLLGTMAIYDKNSFSNYVLKTNVVYTDDDFIGVIFKYKNQKNYHRFILSSENQSIRLDKKIDGELISIKEISNQEWHQCKFSIALFVNPDSIHVYLDDSKVFSIVNEDELPGKVGFVSISNLGSFFDDITLYSKYQIKIREEFLSIVRGPYLQNLLGDSVTIMWRTNQLSNSVVEYYSEKENINEVLANSISKLHEIKLTDLQHSTKYYYRVKSGEVASNWCSFTTPVNISDEFSFIVYSDTQLNFLRHHEIADQIKKHQFDFILHCGDAVQRGPRNDWDTEFFNPLKEILTGKPIYCAMGNHELNSQNYYLNFSNPAPSHENFYSFKFANSFFIFLDNPLAAYPERTFFTDFKPGSIQYEWLKNQLSSREAQKSDWIFVISHVPSYVFGTQEKYSDCKENLVPLFEKYHVDFSFSGHVHGYERGNVNNVNYVVTAGGGGALNKPSSVKLSNLPRFNITYNYCHLTVKNKTLAMKVYDINGNLIDEVLLEK